MSTNRARARVRARARKFFPQAFEIGLQKDLSDMVREWTLSTGTGTHTGTGTKVDIGHGQGILLEQNLSGV